MRLACAAALVLFVACGGRRGREYTADVPLVGLVKSGAPVLYRGIEIGRVGGVERVPTGDRLILWVTRDDAHVRQRDSVRVITLDLMGTMGAEITMGPLTAADAPSGYHLPAATVWRPSAADSVVMRAGAQAMREWLVKTGRLK